MYFISLNKTETVTPTEQFENCESNIWVFDLSNNLVDNMKIIFPFADQRKTLFSDYWNNLRKNLIIIILFADYLINSKKWCLPNNLKIILIFYFFVVLKKLKLDISRKLTLWFSK